MALGQSLLAQALLQEGKTQEALDVMQNARKLGAVSDALLRQLGLTSLGDFWHVAQTVIWKGGDPLPPFAGGADLVDGKRLGDDLPDPHPRVE